MKRVTRIPMTVRTVSMMPHNCPKLSLRSASLTSLVLGVGALVLPLKPVLSLQLQGCPRGHWDSWWVTATSPFLPYDLYNVWSM